MLLEYTFSHANDSLFREKGKSTLLGYYILISVLLIATAKTTTTTTTIILKTVCLKGNKLNYHLHLSLSVNKSEEKN